MPDSFDKDPRAVLDYYRDWTNWLADGEEITVSNWLVPGDLTRVSQAITTVAITCVWLSGGVLGRTYKVTNQITTNQNRKEDFTITIRMREK